MRGEIPTRSVTGQHLRIPGFSLLSRHHFSVGFYSGILYHRKLLLFPDSTYRQRIILTLNPALEYSITTRFYRFCILLIALAPF
jgi:hypothetical protein